MKVILLDSNSISEVPNLKFYFKLVFALKWIKY